jgi:hypothetical protein
MVVARRLKLGLAAVIAVVASGFFTAPAVADTQPDVSFANIPYLAWRGEEVRLVKCFPTIPRSASFTQTDFILTDWSGDPLLTARPNLEAGTVSHFFRSFDGQPCVAGTFQSDKPGLAQIKLVVTASAPTGGTNVGPETIQLKHDFLVGWMDINSVALNNVTPVRGSFADGIATLSPGPISEVAGSRNQLRVDVTGRIPLLQDFSELGIGNELIMPTDWAKLAGAVATWRDPTVANPSQFWDIHDDRSAAEGHSTGTQARCFSKTALGFFDAVDNCFAVGPDGLLGRPPSELVPTPSEIGAFSRVWAGWTLPTIGPFDPQRAGETLLSDGKLDAGDAPMPSLRVDFTLGSAANLGSFCTVRPGVTPPVISGVTALCNSVDKHVVYSRDNKGTDVPASPPGPPFSGTASGPTQGVRALGSSHNLYAPFYATYLPAAFPSPNIATLRNQPEASGVQGTFDANNFNGFLTQNTDSASTLNAGFGARRVPNFYHYWDAFTLAGPLKFAPIKCNEFIIPPGSPTPSGRPIPFVSPSGFRNVAIYTDEHGEGRAWFSAGRGFNLEGVTGTITTNADGGCDLAGVSALGSANITATARYPFQSVTARPVASTVLTKNITSGFSKTITCLPKGPSAFDQTVAICVAQVLDITGSPVAGEAVCFSADFNASAIMPFPETPNATVINDFDLKGSTRARAFEPGGGSRTICMFTNAAGLAAVEVINSNATTVDVTAKFFNEGLFRNVKVTFPITGPVTSAATTTTIVNTNGTVVPAPRTTVVDASRTTGSKTSSSGKTPSTKPAVRAKIVRVKLVRTGKLRAKLIVRVKSTAKKATIRITIKGSKRSVRYKRTVRTNKRVTIRGLRLPQRGALRASVSLVA